MWVDMEIRVDCRSVLYTLKNKLIKLPYIFHRRNSPVSSAVTALCSFSSCALSHINLAVGGRRERER